MNIVKFPRLGAIVCLVWFGLLSSLSHAQITLSTADQLMEIQKIEKLKAKYFRLMDKKQWEQWGQLFTEDAIVVASAFGNPIVWIGRDQIVENNSTFLASALTVHHGHMPEITLTSDTTASGVWAMQDYLVFGGTTKLEGAGHYLEQYVKVDDEWKFQVVWLFRLRENVSTVE